MGPFILSRPAAHTWVLAIALGWASTVAAVPIFVSDVQNNNGAAPGFRNGDVLADDDSGVADDHSILLSEDLFSGNENVDAFHWIDDTTFALSTTNQATLGGITFQDEDVVLYDAVLDTASILFDGSSVFSGNEDVNGFHLLDDGRFLLSTNQDAQIGALAFEDEDIVVYDPGIGVTSAAIFLDGDATFAGEEDVDAIFYNEVIGGLFFSTDANATIAGTTFTDGEVIERRDGLFRRFFSFENLPGANDVDAFSAVPEPSSAVLIGLGLLALASRPPRT